MYLKHYIKKRKAKIGILSLYCSLFESLAKIYLVKKTKPARKEHLLLM
jgi:lipid-A-disaccharide synthase-like uncharacterized protein